MIALSFNGIRIILFIIIKRSHYCGLFFAGVLGSARF